MPDRRNPFSSDEQDIQAIFEQAKLVASEQAKLQAERLAAQQQAVWQASSRIYPQTEPASGFQLALQNRTPSAGQLLFQLAQIEENQKRQDRLTLGLGRRIVADREAEAARLGLGKALSEAVSSGLLTEDQAVAMIVAGGINNQPMSPEDARGQVRAALAQAVASGAVTRERANTLAGELGESFPAQGRSRPDGSPTGGRPRGDDTPPELDDEDARATLLAKALAAAPESGRVVPEADLAELVRSVPILLSRLGRLEDLLYEALTISPCHLSEHAELHRTGSFPCPEQADQALVTLLERLDLPPMALPRRAHCGPDGRRAGCCARDGNIGTWLVYGRTLDPQATLNGAEAPSP